MRQFINKHCPSLCTFLLFSDIATALEQFSKQDFRKDRLEFVVVEDGYNGIGWQQAMEAILGVLETPKIVVLTRNVTLAMWVNALQSGAYCVVPWPTTPEVVSYVICHMQALLAAVRDE
ncbi:MAG: hypothetical protein KGJ93_02910 [Patescibacteria group bacterium]|nr:hypothetical protein [Patescibacteria group bacterium]